MTCCVNDSRAACKSGIDGCMQQTSTPAVDEIGQHLQVCFEYELDEGGHNCVGA